MKAVVMAGGEGSRLRPVTSNIPKPMAPICNKPLMEHILTLLRRHGIQDVLATVCYLADEITGYFDDGADFDVRLSYSVESNPLGTAGAVKKAEGMLREETFLIISGDALTDCNLTEAVRFHREKGSVATLVLCRVPNPLEFGVVITDEEGRIERFLEKPAWSEVFSDTVNTGIYILEPEVFDTMQPGQVYDWSSDIFPKLLTDGRPIYGYVMDGYWADVGSLEHYREAHHDLLAGKIGLPVPEIGANCTIDAGAEIIAPVTMGRNVRVKRGARVGPFTSIGDNCVIEENAVVDRSVVWDSTYIGPSVGVHSAIVCNRVTLKKDAVINEDAVVGDRCLVDVGATVRPRVKIWPDKIVERGSTVTMSLVWGNKWRGNLFRELGVAGLSNIEITPDFACRLGSAFGSCFSPGVRIVTSRDSTRSSRMIKRALISSLLSVGCDVLDLRSSALPITRHFIKASGAAGAMNVRKLPGNTRVTLIEMFDERGAYLTRKLERKIESAFFREDFKRTDPDDLGQIQFASRAIEAYQEDYFRELGEVDRTRRMRIVCDYGYSSLASIFPAMLEHLGVESIALNSFNDAKLAPRTQLEVQRHVDNLKHIVGTLGYDMGVLFTQEGERLTVIDGSGNELEGHTLLAVLGTLLAETRPESKIALSVTAPTALEEFLVRHRAQVIRTKSDVRSLMSASLEHDIALAGDEMGGFIFPAMHPGFDALFSFGMLVTMLQRTAIDLADLTAELPVFRVAHANVRVPFDQKGTVMRRVAEDAKSSRHVEMLDGIKIFEDGEWVLILPDAIEPQFHLFAESNDPNGAQAAVDRFSRRIEAMVT
jgi:mannose-1-phosphate guanylyltransferase/phosphomannomutase